MKKLVLCLVLAAMIGFNTTNAFAVSEAAVLFVLIAPGSRAAAMGEAFAGLADDATAVFYNPAGLAFQQRREVAIMHVDWLPGFGMSDLFYDFAAYRHSVEGLGNFGLNVTYLNLGEQTITGEDSPDPLGTFNSNEFAISATFGTKINENLGFGTGIRFIRSNLAPFGAGAEKGEGKGNSFGVDLAVLYKMPWVEGLSFGANMSNIGPKITYIDAAQADPIPTNLRLGFAYKLINTKYNRLTLVTDANKLLVTREKSGNSDPFYKAIFTSWYKDGFSNEMKKVITSAGAEYWYSGLIALRGGYYYDEIGKVKFFSFGFGIQYSLYRFDFSYVSAQEEGHPLDGTMRFSLNIIGF